MSKNKTIELNEDELLDVVMRKQMTYAEYKKVLSSAKEKGWTVQAYQKGFI